MINRLNEFVAQTKAISTNRWIYFDQGLSYTFDNEQLVQAISNFKEDKKGGEYFSDKTFKIQVDELNDFIKEYKKSIIGVNVKDNTVEIKTSIPNVKLEFIWTPQDTLKLEKIKTFFNTLDTNLEKRVFSYDFSTEDIKTFSGDKPNRMFADFDGEKICFSEENLTNFLMISIFPKYLGKILSSTKELNVSIYTTNKDCIYLVQFHVKNMNLVTDYYGLCSDLIPVQEGGQQ